MRWLLSDILIEKIRGDANFLIFQLLLGEIDGYGVYAIAFIVYVVAYYARVQLPFRRDYTLMSHI